MKPVPVATSVVNAASLYQFNTSVAFPEIAALKETVPVPQIALPVTIGTAGTGLIVAVTVTGVLAQPAVFVSVI